MKFRKFFHIAAIMVSSLASMVAHGKAEESTSKKEKKRESQPTRHHRHHGAVSREEDDATADPPRRHHHHSMIAPDSDSDDIKNSSHAAVWQSYDQRAQQPAGSQNEDRPAAKLDPALMAGAEASIAPLVMTNVAPAPLPGDEQSRYPWKREIVTTTFWVGESATHNNPVPNRASCWDPNWARNYGGNDPSDSGQRTSEYIPASFVPAQNPFYVALPYNDIEHGALKAEASQVIPWFSKEYKGPTKSVCHGRWLAIRFGNKVCYAQWEDAGPFRTDHWQYVFGIERPRPNLNHGAGLDVSPAVRDYLGMNSTDVTDWKFVDFDEIPTGPWARYGDNNTFVQNARRGEGQVADARLPHSAFQSILPDLHAPVVEIR